MKKVLIAAILILWAGAVFGAVGTCTQSAATSIYDNYTKQVAAQEITFACTASADNGSYPATALTSANLTKVAGWLLYSATVQWGGTAPTNPTNIYLYDATATTLDWAGGTLASLATTTPAKVNFVTSSYMWPILGSTGFTMTPTGNSVNSATFTMTLRFIRP